MRMWRGEHLLIAATRIGDQGWVTVRAWGFTWKGWFFGLKQSRKIA